MCRLIDGYLCDKDGTRIVFYDCDPEKNTACKKGLCAYRGKAGGCSVVRNRELSRDGAKPFHINLQKGAEGTFVREYIKGGNHMNGHFTFEQYKEALDGAGPKLKEIILERATQDDGIEFPELKALVDLAYPEPWA